MSRNPSSTEQLAREIDREALFLPERWRLWVFEQLRKGLEAFDQEEHRTDQLNQKMSEAVASLKRVAKHLKLKGQKAKLALTIREFDAAPARVREGWTGRRVAEVMRGSWQLAKGVAFTNRRLPVKEELATQHRQLLARKRRESAFALTAIQEWLASEPSEKTQRAYKKWAKARNQQLEDGQKPLPLVDGIRGRWPFPWATILAAVEQGKVPGDAEQEQPGEATSEERAAVPASRPYILDARLRSRRIRAAREARGWTMRKLAKQAGLDPSNLAKIEQERTSNPSFETMVKLAIALDLTLDDFVTDDRA